MNAATHRHGAIRRIEAEDDVPLRFEALEGRVFLSTVSGTEQLLNTTTIGVQAAAGAISVASDPLGGATVVWESLGQDVLDAWDIFGRNVSAAGVPVGGEFSAHPSALLDNQNRPSVARSPGGGFVVTWDGAGILGLFPSIYAQRFDAAGMPVGSVIGVATGTALTPKSSASVAVASDGTFVVVWESSNQDSLLTAGVYARVYSAGGTPAGPEFRVNVTTAGDQSAPVVALDTSGNMIVAWSGQGTGDAQGVFYRVFDSAGAAVTGEIRANSTVTGSQQRPALAAGPGGGFIVAWDGAVIGDADGIAFQRYSAAYLPIGGENRANQDTAGVQADAAIAHDLDGDFLVAWSGAGLADAVGVHAREFDEDGSARGNQQLVNMTVSGSQAYPAVASTGDNGYLVVWSGQGVGDADGVFARAFLNDAPIVGISPGSASYTENGPGVLVDAALGLSDADHSLLVGATVSIASGFAAGEDQLSFSAASGVVGVWNAATGVLTLTGVATVAAYEAVLRSVVYANSSENPSAAARALRFVVSDGVSSSIAGDRSVQVIPVNDAPVVIPTIGSATYFEGGPGSRIDPTISLLDVDSLSLTGAVVRIATNYAAGEDELQLSGASGIVSSWDPLTGVLTLTGVATLAAYQAALRAVSYINLSQNPSVATRIMEVTASDGAATSISVQRGLLVVAVNDAPVVVAGASSALYVENAVPVALDPAVLLLDPDSVLLTGAVITITMNFAVGQDVLSFTPIAGISGVWNAVTGALVLSGLASISDYETALRSVLYSNLSENPSAAARTIVVAVSDALSIGTPAIYSLTVLAVNDAPVLQSSGNPGPFVENTSGLVLDGSLALFDVDDALLTGAVIAITSNYQPGEDVLTLPAAAGISAFWNAALGVLTLSGIASIAAYRSALRSISYLNSSENPSTAVRTLAATVTDAAATSAPAFWQIAVVAVNDAPAVLIAAGANQYVENAPAMMIDPALVLMDVDSSFLTGATIRIAANWAAGEDELRFAHIPGIVGSWDPLAGVLTFTGFATVVAYQAALRSIAYLNTSENPSSVSRVIQVSVTDGTDWATPASRTITVTPVNDRPVLQAGGGSSVFIENGSWMPLDELLTVSDPDSPLLSGAAVTISGNYAPGEDRLQFAGYAGIQGWWDSVSGTLTLTGVAPIAAYQEALRRVVYRNLSENPGTALRTVSMVASDGLAMALDLGRNLQVVAVNDAPRIVGSGVTPVFVENGTVVAIDPSVLVEDDDDPGLWSATIRFVTGYSRGFDVLSFADHPAISGHWDELAGTLHLTGFASLAAYQAALRSVGYLSTSERPGLSRALSITIDDASESSPPVQYSVSIVEVGDAPSIWTTGSALPYAGTATAAVDAALTVTDADSEQLVGATVTIGTGYLAGTEFLTVQEMPGILASWDAQTGVLTLRGVATLGQYQAALRTVQYRSLSVRGEAGDRGITFEVDDGTATGLGVRAVVLLPNQPPVEPPVQPPPTPVPPVPVPPVTPPPSTPEPPVTPPASPPPGPPTPLPPPPVVPVPPPASPTPPVEPPAAPPIAPQPPISPPTTLPPVTVIEPAPQPVPQPAAALSGPPAPEPTPRPSEETSGVRAVTVSPVGSALDALSAMGVQSWLIIAVTETGGLLAAGCGVWLLMNYSVARHTLITLSRFTLVDLRCLLIMGRGQIARTAA